MHYNFLVSDTIMDVPSAYFPDVSLEEEEEDESVLALLGKQVWKCVETWTREQGAEGSNLMEQLQPEWQDK